MNARDKTIGTIGSPGSENIDGESPARRPKRQLSRRAPSPLALEARLMFDGAAVDAALSVPVDHPVVDAPTPADAVADHATPAATTAETPAERTPAERSGLDLITGDSAAHGARQLVAGNPAADGGRREVAFIDSSINGWTQIAESIGAGIEVVLIDSQNDGLTQIADYLQGRSGIDAIHMIAHGQEGDATFGSIHLNADNIVQYQVDLARVGAALSSDGDLLLYGCDIASGADGMSFIGKLAEATGADVAASADATGSASKGGDWVLEERTGSIEVRSFDLSNAATPDFLLGSPSVTSVDDTTYTEGSGAMVVDNNISITGGTSYDGKYIRFSLTNGQTTDTLGLNSASNVNASGAISISGSSVYLGNGSGRDIIGTVDGTENGLNGQALKINFVSTFTNSSFESGLTGWTAMNQMIDLGSTVIAGFTSPNDASNPSGSGGNDNDVPTTLGTMATAAEAGQSTDGTKSAHLSSTSMTTRNGFDVVHGPAIYSDIFAATAGDAIYFDWRALAGGDAYDVFGYLLNTSTGVTTEVLNATGTSSSGTTAWATASASIPTSGNYRFVFVSGTYDFSGGKAAGASLYVDNVRVFGSRVNDAVVTSLARQVTFASSSDSPATSPTRVFTVTALSATNVSGSDTGLINITTVNDAPTLTGTAQVLSYTENGAATAIDTVIVVADPDSPTNFNGGYLQAQVTANGAAEDQMSVLNQGTAAGQIGVSGSNVTYGGVIIGTIDATLNGVNNVALKIALNSSASTAATQALARAIAYRNTSDAPSVLSRTVTFTLNDGGNTGTGGALSGTRTATVNVTAVDDPSVLTMSIASATYTENNSSFFVDSVLTLVDVDSTTLNGAKVIIAGGFKSTEDQLLPASGTNSDGITYAYDSSKGVLTLSGTATIAQYQAALRAVKYNNTSDNPDVTARTITMTVGNVVALTIGGINHYYEVVAGPLSWTAAKTAAEGRTFQGLTGYLATLTSQIENDFVREKMTADAWIGASDDYTYINAATGTTTYANQAAAEGHWYWVTGPEKGTRISDGNGSPVTVSGGYSYWNTGEPNNSSTENFGEIYSTGAAPGKWNDLGTSSSLAYVVEYSDAGGTPSFSKSITITPQRVNDAPVASGSVALTGITEDATTNSGQLVSSFLSATDPDTDPVTGIAITTLASSRGTWQYSLDNGATWTAAGAVSNSSALLLRTTDRVRFVPDGLNSDAASITYRAWDRTNENSTTLKAGQKADVSTNGGTAAYSSGTQTGNITVTALNDAPVLAAATPSLTTLNEDATSNGGQTIASFLGSSVTDADTSAQQGIAISSLSSGNGTWEYSVNGGSSWIAVGTVAGNSALLLRDTDYIRFKPDGSNGTSASFSYKAWDRATGTQGNKVDTTISGGTTAFSTAANTASITVTSVNDAPVLSGAALTLSGITEKNTGNAGQTVASFLGATMSDVDTGAVQGIAITGLTVAGSGHWEYDSGSGWTTLSSASTTTALLLRATDKVRFVPDGFKGGTGTLTVLGWDTTSGTAGSTANATTTGGTTAFSSTSATASITVTDIDDAPTFTDASGTPTGPTNKTFTEAAGPAAASTSVATGADTTLLLRDDGTGSSIKNATVTISSGFTAGDVLAADVTGTSVTASYNATTGVLTLSGNDTAAHYQAVLRSVTYKSTSEDPTANSTTRTLSWRATDTTNLTSAAITNTITVTPTSDASVMASVPTTWSYVEDDGTRIVAPTLTLSDADDTQLSGATMIVTGTGYLDDGYELLAAVTTGTDITASFDGSTGTLTLSGTDSVANYQKVLRSVTYTNTRDYNNPGASGGSTPLNDFMLDGTTNTRTFNWQVTDANSDGANGSPTYGAQSSAPAATTVTLYNANEIPQVTDVLGGTSHISYTEGGTPATLEGLLTVHDDGVSSITSAFVRVTAGLEAGDQLGFFTGVSGWVQSGTPETGTLTKGSVVIAYNWSLASGDMTLTTTSAPGSPADQSDYTAVMQQIGFVSNSDDPTASNPTRSLIWRVTDSGGLQSAVTAAQTTIIDITAIDDAPTVADLPAGGDVVFIENGADVIAASGFSLSDPDDTRVLSATVAVSGTGFLPGEEYLSLPGAVISAGSNWSASNIGGSGIDASYTSATGTLTLTAVSGSGVDIATMQAMLRQVAYGSIDDNPTVAATTRTLTWTVTDVFGSRITDVPAGNNGDAGATSTPATSTVTLSPRNDAPALAGFGGTVSYTEGGSAITLASGSTLSDVDDSSLSSASVWISAGFAAGDTLAVMSAGGLTTGYDSSTGILTLSGTASKATYQAALRSIQFSSTSDDPSRTAASRTVSWTITDANAPGDGAQTSSAVTISVDITAVDDAATVSGLGSASFTENGSSVAVAPSATLGDADDATLAGLTVTISAGKTTGDLLSVGADLSSTGITVTSYDSSTGALVLSGTASLADYQAALRSIVFTSSSDDPAATSTSRTLTWSTVSSFASRLTDADGGSNDASSGVTTASAGSNTINITALNDAPVISLDDGTVDPSDSPVFEQGSAPVFALHVGNTAGGITITDADSGDKIASASVQITGNLLSSDVLSIATPGGWSLGGSTFTKGSASVTFSYNSGTGTLSLSGAATRSEYQELLGSVKFSNGSVAPTASGASRELTWSVTDNNTAGDGARTATGTSQLTIRDRNDAPTILPLTATASYAEGALSVVVPTVTITDPDPGEVVTATLTLSLPAAGTLSVSGGASYSISTGVWTMTDTVANVNAALASISFTPATDNDLDVTIAVNVTDGGEDGAIAATGTLTLDVTGVNDAPVMIAASPALTALTEDDTGNAGQTVASFRGAMTDVDTGTQFGIVIHSLSSGNGTWQYSIDGGTTWNAVGSVSDSSALALRDTDRIRFVPNGQNATSATVGYRAWDRSTGAAGSKLDASSTGNATPFSSVSDTASLNVTAVNDAPVLTAAAPSLTTLTEDDTNDAGHTVASVLGSSVADVDSGAVQGIAINALSSGNGAWQYSLDGGSTWNAVGTVSGSSALLLAATDYIRFVPDGQNATSASFTYRAWDQSSGSAGSKVNASVSGLTTAFSSTTDTASITVSAVNDAPTLTIATPVLTTITEDDTSNAGQTVAAIVGATIGDVDSGALQGIALTGVNNGNGSWQYSLDGGSTWTTVGSLAATTGILLRDTDRVRFLPDAQNATSGSFTYLAWDRTSSSAGSTVSTATSGGTSSLSLVENTASITVTAVNDAPINDVIPTYSGGARVDTTLRQDGVITANPETWHDVDIGDPATTFHYQWQVADDASGTGLHDITGASGINYTLTAAEIGKFVRVKVFGGDGTTETIAYSTYTQVTNHDPVSSIPLVTRETTESVPISFTVPAGSFTDSDPEDTIYYSATRADGSPLPSWISFDPVTRTFTGTPGGGDVGEVTLRVTASDHGLHAATADFTMRVLALPLGLPPAVVAPPPALPPELPVAEPSRGLTIHVGGFLGGGGGSDRAGGAGGEWDVGGERWPSENEGEGDPVLDDHALTITRAVTGHDDVSIDRNGVSLDSVLGVSASRFASGDSSELSIRGLEHGDAWRAGDFVSQAGGLTRPDGFRIVVAPSPTDSIALLLVRPLNDQVSKPADGISMSVPADTFSHTQRDAVVILSASRVDGSRLPAWLQFNAMKGEFSGVAPATFDDDLDIKITARDNFGNEVSTVFRFRIHASNARVSFIGREGLSAQLRAQAGASLLRAGDERLQGDHAGKGKLAPQALNGLPRQRVTA